MNESEYINKRLKEIADFQDVVQNCDFEAIQLALNNEWFNKIRESGQKSWSNNNEQYCEEYFTFRWLYEENQFEYIKNSLKNLYSHNRKKNIIRNKIKDITTPKWKSNECAAFEIAVICKLFNDNVLVDIEPKYGSNSKKKADALINIDSREILVEVTAFQNGIEYISRTGAVDIKKNIYRIIHKVIAKYNDQIINSEKPCTIFIMKPSGVMMDQIQINWAVNTMFEEEKYQLKNVSAIVFFNGYTLISGACYNNPNSFYPFTEKEREYIRSLFRIDSKLEELVDNGLLSDKFFL